MREPVEDLDRLEAFTYLTVPDRSTYLAIMRLFTGSLMTDLSAQHVADALDLSLDTAISRDLTLSEPALPRRAPTARINDSTPVDGHGRPHTSGCGGRGPRSPPFRCCDARRRRDHAMWMPNDR